MAGFGVWRMTRPMTGAAAVIFRTRWRALLRWAAVPYFAFPLLFALAETFDWPIQLHYPWLVMTGGGAMLFLAYLVYLARLARGCGGGGAVVTQAHVLGGVAMMLMVLAMA